MMLKKVPKKIIVFDYLSCLAWIIPNLIRTVFIGRTGNDIVILSSKVFIVFFILLFLLPILKKRVLFPMILDYKNNLEKAEKAINLYSFLSFMPGVFALLGSLLISFELNFFVKPRIAITFVFLSFSNASLMMTLFSSFTFRYFEKWVSFVPVREENKGFSLKSRIVILGFYVIASTVFITLTPFIRTETVDVTQKLLTSSLPLFLYALFISLLDLSIISGSTQKRLALLQERLKHLATGNYSQENIEINSRDEMALLFNSYNTFLNFNKNFLKTLIEAVNVSNEASIKLSSNMESTSKAIDFISNSIETVDGHIQNQSSGVLETQSTLEQIARNLDSLNMNIENQATSITESVSTIEEMSASIKSVDKAVNENMQAINELKKASEEGNKAVTGTAEVVKIVTENSEGLLEASSVIQNIASQTNLLAMNAAIEAAHAGDAGKGFAVVADEIRKLAEESSLQGKTITSVLKDLKTQIETLSVSSSSVENQFGIIVKLLNLVQNRSSEILNAMTEQSSGSTQVLNTVREINEITEQVKLGSSEMVTGNKEVAKESQKLVESSEEITANMKNISLSAENIKKSIEMVLSAGEEEKIAVQKVAKQLEQLKV